MVAQQSSSSEEKKELEPSPAQQSSSAEGIVEPSLEISTPSKQNDTTVQKTKIFYKFSPFKRKEEKLDCQHCNKVFESVRGLKNHLSEKHQGLPGLDPSVKEAVGTCRLKLANDKECGKKFSTGSKRVYIWGGI